MEVSQAQRSYVSGFMIHRLLEFNETFANLQSTLHY